MKFKEFGVKIETKCTNLMMEDIFMKIEKYTLIDSLCVIASRTINQPNCTTCTVWALHKPAVTVRWKDGKIE